MALVFLVLASLYALILIFSKLVGGLNHENQSSDNVMTEQTAPSYNTVPSYNKVQVPEMSAGELKLKGVDERTAAMIMAIVSHESGIPLSELQFKSIKAVD